MRIALAQINSTTDVAANLAKVEDFTRRAADSGAELVVFPEATMSAFNRELRGQADEHLPSWQASLANLAAETGTIVVVGEFAAAEDKVINLLAAYYPDGSRAEYAKIHLYDAFGFKESETVVPGEEPLLIDVAGEEIGLTICYDIRFPKLYAEVSRRGARIAIVSASWGAGPGKVEQWQVLARARALDSNMFIIALGQADPQVTGVEVPKNGPTGVGHSLVVDPFGRVVVELGGEEALEVVDVDPSVADEAATAIPVLANAKLGY
ncbi:putative amidohydrolase [Brevibacterium sanguinis]|uniref:Amidohydrolase n=2 Tax=Brevibacterium TaxID=1696 RepID=A0ABX9GRM7_9MICO|nr:MULTISPECIES: carbon-nitrogen hydrolase family protein [Brevibacterium]RBP66115.1 putative amidohydrolase [Brevibacterium sanguinis]RBP72766.1 putative amidohydrolase [Brevibacterium celere]